MWGCVTESTFWCWRRLLKVPWTARRSNQSILKEISPECSLEGLILKQKLQYFGHLMRRKDSLEKTLMLGKTEGGRRRGWQRMWMASPTQWTWIESTSRVGDRQGGLECCSPWGRKGLDMTEQLNWTDLSIYDTAIYIYLPCIYKVLRHTQVFNSSFSGW